MTVSRHVKIYVLVIGATDFFGNTGKGFLSLDTNLDYSQFLQNIYSHILYVMSYLGRRNSLLIQPFLNLDEYLYFVEQTFKVSVQGSYNFLHHICSIKLFPITFTKVTAINIRIEFDSFVVCVTFDQDKFEFFQAQIFSDKTIKLTMHDPQS